jgi:hypothetical protein
MTRVVPTDFGWGLFWTRAEPTSPLTARLYYAHVGFDGQVTAGPMLLRSIARLIYRGRYYLAAWHTDHFGLLIADQSTLYHYTLSLQGALSGPRAVGPVLFNSTVYGQEADGDMDAYPGGFVVAIEGECAGHLCSYAFRLAPDGQQISATYNLVDFDYTHQFQPRVAFNGTDSAILSVKDLDIPGGGVVTKYLRTAGNLSQRAKVVPSKEYLWDELPDIAWNGDHFGAVWTENSGRDHALPWQIHFASFQRTYTSGTLIGDRVLDVHSPKSQWRWGTQIHPLGADWLVQYLRGQPSADPLAVYHLVSDQGDVLATLTPFTMNADALGSSMHFSPEANGQVAVARGYYESGAAKIVLQFVGAPVCRGS